MPLSRSVPAVAVLLSASGFLPAGSSASTRDSGALGTSGAEKKHELTRDWAR